MLDIINVSVTIISIITTLCSFKFAKEAKQYKEEALRLIDTLELEHLIVQFQRDSGFFLEKTRGAQWHRGVDTNLIISPFKAVLSSFGCVYHLMKNKEVLRTKVHMLNEIIQTYPTANSTKRKQVNELVLEITEILHEEAKGNRGKIIGSS
jgi:hypothetical protein|nr:hypothetical protein [uncultured Porphyromonas sp.]